MPAGYVRTWISFLEALDHVERVAGCARQEACDGLLAALRDSAVHGRFADTGEVIDPPKWYRAEVYRPGSVAFPHDPTDRSQLGRWPSNRLVELRREDVERLWPTEPLSIADLDPNERLTLSKQVQLLARTMPEEHAKGRIDKAFRFRELAYQPEYALAYDGARIDWDSGRVILPRIPRQPFTPTLTTAEFVRHFMRSGLGATEAPRTEATSAEKSTADAGEPQEVTTERAMALHPTGIRTTKDERVEAACGDWIAAPTERPRNKETAFADAKAAVAHIGALSRKAFDRAWARRAPPEWKHPGRRGGN